jgi:hypothetical protein
MTTRGRRLLVFDRTCVGARMPVGLSTAWTSGARLYRAMRRIDAVKGVTSWREALAWLASDEATSGQQIEEIQYWGHGRWGRVFVDADGLDASAFREGHALHAPLERLRERLLPGEQSLVWLRTCEAFGADAGLDLAMRMADFFGARVAGHTHVIGALQSGLHGLRPGHRPDWSPAEGLEEGTPAEPVRAHGSAPWRPRTIHCLEGRVPEAWFA